MLAFFPSRQTPLAACLLCALFLGALGCTPAGPRAVLKGERLLRQGRVDEAIERLELAVTLVPDEARAWNQLGLAYHAAGRGEDAERAYRAALDRDRNLAVARFNLGNLLLEQGQVDRAVPELVTFTGLRVNAPEGWLQLGQAQLQSGQPAAAERSFLRAYQLQTNSAAALNGIGLSLVQRARYTNAWPYFAAALQREPGFAPALLNAGVLAQQHLRETNLAIRAYEGYLALPEAPRKAEVETLLAQLRTPPPVRPDQDKVQATSEPAPTGPAPQATPGSPVAMTSPSASAAAEEQTETPGDRATEPESTQPPPKTEEPATETEPTGSTVETASTPTTAVPPDDLEQDTETTPPAPSADRREPTLARISTQQVERLPRSRITVSTQAVARATPPRVEPQPEPPRAPAEVDLPPALQDMPGEHYPYYAYGQARAGDRNEAIRLLNLGINDQRALRTRLALETYRRAVEVDPSLFETHYNRGVAAFELGELPEAMRAYERALAVNPDSVPARFNFAATLQRAGYWLDAAAQLSALVEAHPEETRAHMALGNLYADKFRDNARAIEHYRRVLELEPQHPNATSLRFWIEAH